MATIGSIAPFDADSPQMWDTYASQVNFFCEANNIIADEKKRATLLAVCGLRTLSILRSLISPALPHDKSYQEIVNILKQYFNPQPSVIYQRFQFHRRWQREEENVSAFLADLRRLAESCDFGLSLTERLRDQFVCGLRDETIQRKLLTEESLTLEIAIQRSLAAESALVQVREIRATNTPMSTVDLIQRNRSTLPRKNVSRFSLSSQTSPTHKRNIGASQSGFPLCYGCGSQHNRVECPFKKTKCHFCQKIGHLQRVCRAKQRTIPGSANHCMAVMETDDDVSHIHEIRHDASTPKSSAHVYINGKECKMEIDSGSEYSILSSDTLSELCNGKIPELHPVTITLRDFQHHSISFKGYCVVHVQYGVYSCHLPLLITESPCTNLLGREWFTPLGISLTGVHLITEPSIQDIINEFPQVFSSSIGTYKGPAVSLPVDPKFPPIRLRARPLPLAMKPKVDVALDTLLRDGIIEPVENPVWTTPVVPILKPTGEVRLCGDYKVTVNRALQNHPYPIPAVHHLLTSLPPSSIFAKIDLAKAYLQLPVDDMSANIQTIITHRGAFRVKRLQFGICVAPGMFQCIIDNLLGNISGVFPYFDDILICASSTIDLCSKLRTVFKRLAHSGLRANKEKCVFGVDSVEFLGYTIDCKGLHPSPSKTTAIQNACSPRNKIELKAFLGLINFYNNFLPDRATVAEPLHRLLQTNATWTWTPQHEKAFLKLKEALMSNNVLVPFDPHQSVLLTCDASPYGVGAVLSMQYPDGSSAPVAFASRTLSKAERNYAQIDKEALAIIFGVKRFHHFLFGIKFNICTDHRPLLGIFTSDKPTPIILSPRMQRWTHILNAYSFKLEYKPGKKVANADALSRFPLPSTECDNPNMNGVFFLEELEDPPVTAEQVAHATRKDFLLSRVKNYIFTAWPSRTTDTKLQPFLIRRNELSTHKNCLLWGSRVIIPYSLQRIVLNELHLGHSGIVRTKALARSYVWWPSMDRDIENLVGKCKNCQVIRHACPRAPIHPWEPPSTPWSRLHVDFAGPIDGQMLFVVVDAYSKWVEVRRMPKTTSVATVTVLRELFSTHGIPECVVSDNGPQFVSSEFSTFLASNGIRHARIAPYHPSSNGLAERAVQSVKESLKRITHGNWEQRIAQYLLAQHITPSTTTGLSPAEMLFHRRLRTCLDFLHPDRAPKSAPYKHHRLREFQPDDTVFTRAAGRGSPWIPAMVEQRTGPLSYEVRTDLGLQHKHIDQLRSRTVDTLPTVSSPAEETPLAQNSLPSVTLENTNNPSSTHFHPTSPIQTPKAYREHSQRQRRPPVHFKDYVTY